MSNNLLKNKNKKNNKISFTLVKVIVVLTILAVLPALMIPAMTGLINKTRQERLMDACRTCVTAAQTLIIENYNELGKFIAVPWASDVQSLAGIKTGSVSNISVIPNEEFIEGPLNDSNIPYLVSTLTYTNDNGEFVTYVRGPSPHFNMEAPRTWEKGIKFNEGDIIIGTDANGENPLLFRCMKAHTSGSRSYTRNPYVQSNKGSWEVIGTPDGKPPQYQAKPRFGIGVVVQYNGNLYARTEYNLIGGQTPYSKSSSRYWILVGSNLP